jgi:hemerythrin
MEWSERYSLATEAMDANHREFVVCVERLAHAPDGEVLAALDELIAHSVEHFERENRWMKESGFPPIHIHMGEHQRVLALLQSVRRMAERSVVMGRQFAAELPGWFDTHLATMDGALAAHMKHRGFVPV